MTPGLWQYGIIGPVTTTPEDLPDDIAALQAALVAAHEKHLQKRPGRRGSRRNWRWPKPRPPTIKP